MKGTVTHTVPGPTHSTSSPAFRAPCVRIMWRCLLELRIPGNFAGAEQRHSAENGIFKLAFKYLKSKEKHKRNKN